MIRFVDEHPGHFGGEAICHTLALTVPGFITSQGYRAAKRRPACARALRDEILTEELVRLHAENYGIYGARKMYQVMRRVGWEAGRDQVARLIKTPGLQGVRRGRKPVTTRGVYPSDSRPDVVKRHFHAERPHQLWAADIPRQVGGTPSCVRTMGAFAYAAFITDVFTRRIAGWAVSSSW